jgi:signal transduction histidine kinase
LASTLNSMLDRVHEAAARDRRFLDQASHELRTPLAVLKAELDLALSRPRSSAELEAALRNASEETDRLLRLAEDLLVLSRSKGEGLEIHTSDVDVQELLDQVCEGHRVRAETAGSSLSREGNRVIARVDPVRIRQALEDLLDNAIRHGGGVIRVHAECGDGVVEISVLDSGPGFRAELLDAFGSGPRGDGRAGEGSNALGLGLGLPIVRAIAEAHGGSLEARNLPEGGAVVTMRVPG